MGDTEVVGGRRRSCKSIGILTTKVEFALSLIFLFCIIIGILTEVLRDKGNPAYE